MIADITSFKGEIIWDTKKPDGTFQKLLDISRLKNLGWSAKINLKMDYKRHIMIIWKI